MTNLASAAWDASMAADGSLLGRVRTAAGALGRVGDRRSVTISKSRSRI